MMGKNRDLLTARWPKDVITVDPGFGGTGWAYWLGNEFPLFGVIKEKSASKGLEDEERLSLLFAEFDTLLHHYTPEKVVLESMQLWASLQSQTSAARGDLFLLQTLVGGYCSICWKRSILFKLLTPMQWKGQLSKEALRARIELINGQAYPDHAEDAVGIGIHLSGIL